MAIGDFFRKIKTGLAKSASVIGGGFQALLGRKLDDNTRSKIESILLTADMGVATTEAVMRDLEAAYKDKEVTGDLIEHVKQALKDRLKVAGGELNYQPVGPTVIMIAGVNGSGKTTSIAKLGSYLTGQKKRVLLGACDTFRAAAADQLELWAKRIGVEIVKGAPRSDPSSVAHDACQAAVARKADVAIIDTAGRQHTHGHLMKELEKIHRVIGKVIPGGPHEVLLVLDAANGQNAIQQATMFTKSVKCTGIILAKLDGTAKGGAVFAIREKLDLPVKFVGLGEKPEDLAPFDPDSFVDGLFTA